MGIYDYWLLVVGLIDCMQTIVMFPLGFVMIFTALAIPPHTTTYSFDSHAAYEFEPHGSELTGFAIEKLYCAGSSGGTRRRRMCTSSFCGFE